MIDLLAIYICSKCGEVLEDQVYYYEHIDCGNDKIYPAYHCQKCNREVTPKMMKDTNGNLSQCWQSIDHERFLWATGFYDENDDLEQEYEAGLYYTCEVCGGEYWDGGTSCTCFVSNQSNGKQLVSQH